MNRKLTIAALATFVLTAIGAVIAVSAPKEEARAVAEKPAAKLVPSPERKPGKTEEGSKAKSAEKGKAEAPTRRPRKAEIEAKNLAATLSDAQSKKLLALLNEGEIKDIISIPGVGETRAKAIIEARPLQQIEQVRTIKGIGAKTYEGAISFARNNGEAESAPKAGKGKKA